jgi:hypothetical protein
MRHRTVEAPAPASDVATALDAATDSKSKKASAPQKGDPILALVVLGAFFGLNCYLATQKLVMVVNVLSLAVSSGETCRVPLS